VLQGRIEAKKEVGRPRTMTLDWFIDTDSGITYQKVKQKALRRDEGRYWNLSDSVGFNVPLNTL